MALDDIVVGFALFLVIEGLVYALAPFFVRDLARQLPSMSDQQLRIAGLAAIVAGVVIVWMVRRGG
jgi:uncharacterized protein